jgi:hypothetical protein
VTVLRLAAAGNGIARGRASRQVLVDLESKTLSIVNPRVPHAEQTSVRASFGDCCRQQAAGSSWSTTPVRACQGHGIP